MERSRENLSLHDAAELLLEECRTILPGIQALFGFQLIAVFSPGFDEKLVFTEQVVHLAAMVLVAIAVALIMTPAAYHRQTGPMKVDGAFIYVTGRAVLCAMVALMLGLTLEFYVVAKVILAQPVWAILIAAFIFSLIIILWFMSPRIRALRKFIGAEAP